jgi:hypothetical protein
MISSFSSVAYLMPGRPQPRSCFFEQPQLERLFGHDLFQRTGFIRGAGLSPHGHSQYGLRSSTSVCSCESVDTKVKILNVEQQYNGRPKRFPDAHYAISTTNAHVKQHGLIGAGFVILTLTLAK